MGQLLADASLPLVFGLLAVAAAVIGFAGTRLAGVADELADRTGMGEIIAGALFVGGATSLPGIITSVSTAAQGYPGLAIGNAVGGLTVQTAFLAVADLAYRRANLEHAAASVVGLTQGTMLLGLLTLPLLAASSPELTVMGVHPVTPLLFVAYGLGLRLLANVRGDPMWSPVVTDETQHEEVELEDAEKKEQETGDHEPPEDPVKSRYDETSTRQLWLLFLLYAGLTAAAGYAVGETSIALVGLTGLGETAIGTVFTAVANSLPELVTAVAAVRVGAVNLAVGDVIGGNSFEVLFLAAADVVYLDGSLYHRFTDQNVFITVMAILMTAVLLLGMLRRERHGIGGIGFESALVLLLYGCSVLVALS
ncbi:sodium:calcium antiporter [Geminicoccaceae bacterium 1502E]|nr:sodium:calcium antiporter [Geminicoccaceae bacterium 1502E]